MDKVVETDNPYFHKVKIYDIASDEKSLNCLIHICKALNEINNKKNEYYGEDCPICTYKMNNVNYIHITTCGHVFHNNCIDNWFSQNKSKSCPLCRQTC